MCVCTCVQEKCRVKNESRKREEYVHGSGWACMRRLKKVQNISRSRTRVMHSYNCYKSVTFLIQRIFTIYIITQVHAHTYIHTQYTNTHHRHMHICTYNHTYTCILTHKNTYFHLRRLNFLLLR
jgi:hypothetical protein